MRAMKRVLPASLLAIGATTLSACGSTKVQRSHTPVKLGAGASSTGAAAGAPATGSARRTATGRFVGADESTRYGDIQVELSLDHGRIVDVQWLKLPFDRPRSQLISQQAAPILRSEVLSAQSAQINLLSGATFTSDAWAASVQSALSQAR